MPDLILLLDPTRCPRCFRPHSVNRDSRRCRYCGTRLFFQNDGEGPLMVDYWRFMNPSSAGILKGWCHSSQLLNPQPIIDYRFKEIKPPAPSKVHRDPGHTSKMTLVREEKDYGVFMEGRRKFITRKNLCQKKVSRPTGLTKTS